MEIPEASQNIEWIVVAIVSVTIVELFRVFILPYLLRFLGKKDEFSFGKWRRPFIKVYVGRSATLAGAAKMFSRALPDDIIFGQCKTCSDYPKFYVDSLEDALKRRVTLNMLISSIQSPENHAFAKELLSYKTVTIKAHEFEFLRYIGIMNKELIVVVTEPVSYLGIHIFDKTLAVYLQKNFEQAWSDPESKLIKLEEL